MALEQVFEYPKTLRKLGSDPIGKLLDGFCHWLLDHGFSRGTVRKHLFNLSHLNEYLGGPRSGIHQTVSLREVKSFFRVYPLRCRNRRVRKNHLRRVGYSINRFLAYLRDSRLLDSLPQQKIYQPLCTAISNGCAITSTRPMERFKSAASRSLSSFSGLAQKPRQMAYPG